jgi:hypothetical protein
MYPGNVQYPEGKIVVGDKTMQLLKAMRGAARGHLANS